MGLVTHLGNICRIRHRAGFTYGSPGAGFPGVAAVRSESAIYWRAGSHRASAAGKLSDQIFSAAGGTIYQLDQSTEWSWPGSIPSGQPWTRPSLWRAA